MTFWRKPGSGKVPEPPKASDFSSGVMFVRKLDAYCTNDPLVIHHRVTGGEPILNFSPGHKLEKKDFGEDGGVMQSQCWRAEYCIIRASRINGRQYDGVIHLEGNIRTSFEPMEGSSRVVYVLESRTLYADTVETFANLLEIWAILTGQPFPAATPQKT